jgi:hypothetical protein
MRTRLLSGGTAFCDKSIVPERLTGPQLSFNFTVRDIRFGALRSRLTYTKEIIESYLNGNCEKIEELEVEPLYLDCRTEGENKSLHFMVSNWKTVSTVNPL